MKIEIKTWVNHDRICVHIKTPEMYIFEYEPYTGERKYLQTDHSIGEENEYTTDTGFAKFKNIEEVWVWINEVIERVRYELDLTKKLEEDIKKIPTEIEQK